MPGRNGTGPLGQGTQTGRGLGFCKGDPTGVYSVGSGCGFGRGMGYGRGLGFGCRKGFGGYYAGRPDALAKEEILKEEKEILQSRLDIVSRQLDDLQKTEA
ncbi:MAG TPA: hypothetical protein DIT32_05295 [Peptococcaceae bacterium]|nr:hypothetical protein [Peptococcaceae bacterium]